MPKVFEAEPRIVEVGDRTLVYEQDTWNVNRLDLLDVVTEHPEVVDELTDARVAYQADNGNSMPISANGWRIDFYSPSPKRVSAWAPEQPNKTDPRIKKYDTAAISHELVTSTVMTEAPWLQAVVDLERVTGDTLQDFMFVAGINELQKLDEDQLRSYNAERVAAFTDIVSGNPADFFSNGQRLTRNIQLLPGIKASEGNFKSKHHGPNIRHGADFGLNENPDAWVAWSWAHRDGEAANSATALYPVNEIASVREQLAGGVDGLYIPTILGKQALSTV